MQTIAELLFNNQRAATVVEPSASFPFPYAVGLEFEVENCPDRGTTRGWRVVGDGSLRDEGVEYVLRGARGGVRLERAFKSLEQEFKRLAAPRITERCSVHVHMDALDMTLEQYARLVAISTLFEDHLFAISGDRRGNIYCLAESDLNDGGRRATGNSMFNSSKYCALNTSVTRTLGSIEYRHHEGSLDVERIAHWVRVIMHLKAWAMTSTVATNDLLYTVSGYYEALVHEVFGRYQDIILDVPDGYNKALDSARCIEVAETGEQPTAPGNFVRLSHSAFYKMHRRTFASVWDAAHVRRVRKYDYPAIGSKVAPEATRVEEPAVQARAVPEPPPVPPRMPPVRIPDTVFDEEVVAAQIFDRVIVPPTTGEF